MLNRNSIISLLFFLLGVISVKAQQSQTGDTLELKIVSDSGQTTFMTSSITTFSLELRDVIPDHIEWKLESSRREPNFGNIIDGMYSDKVTVSFNEIYSSPTGILRAFVSKNGVTVMAVFVVNLEPKPVSKPKKKTDCTQIPELDSKFIVSPFVYCSHEVVTLTISDYNPEYQYRWHFNGTSFIASGKYTRLQFSEENNYVIRLEITIPEGCSYITPLSDTPIITVNQSVAEEGIILPVSAEFCTDSNEPLVYASSSPLQKPKDIIWMKDNKEAGRGESFQPKENGLYWVVLVDANGCKSYKPHIVKCIELKQKKE